MDIERIKKIASLDLRGNENIIRLNKLYKKIPIYKKMIEKEKDPENSEILLSIILNQNNKKKKGAKIHYIHVNEFLSTTIIDKDNNYLVTVYGESLIEILKKALIIIYMVNKEEK